MMKNISIKWKIFLYLIGFCSALLVLLWLFQVVFLEKFYKSIKINTIKSSAVTIMANINSLDLSELVKRISINNDVCIEIVAENGVPLYSSDILKDCLIHKMSPFEKIGLFIHAQANGGELFQSFYRDDLRDKNFDADRFIGRVPPPDPGRQESIIYAKIITNQNGQTMLMLINSIISPVNATVTTLRVQLYYITGFMLLFSVILALIIARRVSGPIEKINESAKILAKGNYNTEFRGSGYKEISELSDTLNYTAKELDKVESLRRELIANISHDLRTPLTLIGGYAEAMRDLKGENNAENAQIIVDETKRLTTLVNDVLDISKLQAGGQQIYPTRYNLTESLKKTIEQLNELVRQDGYRIKFSYAQEIQINADETKIAQAFYNLLTNAINYTGDDKMILVLQTTDNDRVKIEVVDSGEGIAQEDLPYIWDRYYRVDKTHRRAITGTGLGLSIVKSIIELHGGEYGVASQPNAGSVFWFSLKI